MAPYTYNVISYEVIDGDTVRCVLDLGFDTMKKIDVRIIGVNTPEKRGREKVAGIPVRLVVMNYLESLGGFRVVSHDWGKYAGRCLGDITSDTGQDLSNFLLSTGLAKPYGGDEPTAFTQLGLDRVLRRCFDELRDAAEGWLQEATAADGRVNHYDAAEDYVLVEWCKCFGFLDDDLRLTAAGREFLNREFEYGD